jgi:hypothetical protein
LLFNLHLLNVFLSKLSAGEKSMLMTNADERPTGGTAAARRPHELDRRAIGSERSLIGRFCCKGDYWVLSYGDEDSLVHDRQGLRHVAYLLCYPQKEIHVFDLVSFIPTSATRARPPGPKARRNSCSIAVISSSSFIVHPRTQKKYREWFVEEDAVD